jgi:hypothetical protein
MSNWVSFGIHTTLRTWKMTEKISNLIKLYSRIFMIWKSHVMNIQGTNWCVRSLKLWSSRCLSVPCYYMLCMLDRIMHMYTIDSITLKMWIAVCSCFFNLLQEQLSCQNCFTLNVFSIIFCTFPYTVPSYFTCRFCETYFQAFFAEIRLMYTLWTMTLLANIILCL